MFIVNVDVIEHFVVTAGFSPRVNHPYLLNTLIQIIMQYNN